MADALVDTDLLIDHLRGARELETDLRLAYSIITRCELFAGEDDEARINGVLETFTEIQIDRRIAETAGRIRRDHQLLIADALVGATALISGLPLLTRNRRHFSGISGLTIGAI